MRSLLHNFGNASKLPPLFPFRDDQLDKITAETTVRGALQQLSKLYVKETSATVAGQCVKKYTRQWATLRKHILEASPQGFKSDSMERAHRSLDYLLNDVLERRWLTECSWESSEVWHSDGWLNVIWFGKSPPQALMVGIWLGKGTGKALDLQRRIDMARSSPLRAQRLLILHPDGADALTRKSKEVFDAALSQNLDIRVQLLANEDLAKIMTFQEWLEAVADDSELDPDKSRQIVRDIIKTEMEPFFKMLQRIRVEEEKVET